MAEQITSNLQLLADKETTQRFLDGAEAYVFNTPEHESETKISIQALMIPTPSPSPFISLDLLENVVDSLINKHNLDPEAAGFIKLLKTYVVNHVCLSLGHPFRYIQCTHCTEYFVDKIKVELCEDCLPLYYEDTLLTQKKEEAK